jgi:hypothetical protein
MANQGAKKRKEENARHMANLRRLIIACNVFFTITNSSQALGFLCLISFLYPFILIIIIFCVWVLLLCKCRLSMC